MAIGWLGQAIWPTEGTEDGGRNLELDPKRFQLEQEHGPRPEQSTSTTKSRSKRQSQCSARRPARATARGRGFAPVADGLEGSKEARSEGEGI